MTRNDLTITALIPTYNCGHCIGEAIDSVLAQTRPPDEIIVVDDGSTDNTREVVTGYSDKVRYLHKANGGCASARNMGIEASHSEWIAFLDSDDLWMENHLEDVSKVIEANASLAWACTATVFRKGREGPVTPITPEETLDRFVGPTGVIENYFRGIAAGVDCSTPALVIRKEVFERLGGFNTQWVHGSDVDMWRRIACAHLQIGFGRRPGVINRRFRGDSITAVHWPSDLTERCRQLECHLELTSRTGHLDDFRPIAARLLQGIAHSAFYSDEIGVIRHIARRHGWLLSPLRRAPIVLMSLLPDTGRRLVRLLMRLRLRLLGRLRQSDG